MKPSTLLPSSWRSSGGVTLHSDDGIVSFRLAPSHCGLFVERIRVRPEGAFVAQSTVFADERSFQQWCDADSVRFDYPVVYVSLKREGSTLFHRDH
jgi:hypothetical protein